MPSRLPLPCSLSRESDGAGQASKQRQPFARWPPARPPGLILWTTMSARLSAGALVMVGALWAAVAIGHAQMRKPTADLAALTATSGVRAGESARLALRVALPEGY